MSEYVAAHIVIGGPIPRLILPGLLKAIHDDGGLRLDDTPLAPMQLQTEEDVINALDANSYLCLSDPEANSGVFEGLENFCKEWDIEYTRYSDGLPGGYDPEISFRRSGDNGATTLATNEHWDPVVSATVAVTAFRALQSGNIHAALTALEPYNEGYEVPPLAPFQIIDKVE